MRESEETMNEGCDIPAVILAAGRGTRLGALTAERPKVLLTVGGKTLLERQLQALRRVGVRRILVVTGFARETVATFIAADDVTEIYNARWASTNNIVSLSAVGERLAQGFLLLNGDTLFDERILRRLAESPLGNAVAVDTRKRLADEEMKVKATPEGLLAAMAKSLPPAESCGEYIGLAKFDADGARALRATMDAMMAAGRTDTWYDIAIGECARSFPIHCLDTDGAAWTEIDTPEDLRDAEAIVAAHIFP